MLEMSMQRAGPAEKANSPQTSTSQPQPSRVFDLEPPRAVQRVSGDVCDRTIASLELSISGC